MKNYPIHNCRGCDWNRIMAQHDDNIIFLSKYGNIVHGRKDIGEMVTTWDPSAVKMKK